MFASGTIIEHLVRGGTGIGLFVAGVGQAENRPLIATGLILLSLLPMRGCPICWTIGLFETIYGTFQRRSAGRSSFEGGTD